MRPPGPRARLSPSPRSGEKGHEPEAVHPAKTTPQPKQLQTFPAGTAETVVGDEAALPGNPPGGEMPWKYAVFSDIRGGDLPRSLPAETRLFGFRNKTLPLFRGTAVFWYIPASVAHLKYGGTDERSPCR